MMKSSSSTTTTIAAKKATSSAIYWYVRGTFLSLFHLMWSGLFAWHSRHSHALAFGCEIILNLSAVSVYLLPNVRSRILCACKQVHDSNGSHKCPFSHAEMRIKATQLWMSVRACVVDEAEDDPQVLKYWWNVCLLLNAHCIPLVKIYLLRMHLCMLMLTAVWRRFRSRNYFTNN